MHLDYRSLLTIYKRGITLSTIMAFNPASQYSSLLKLIVRSEFHVINHKHPFSICHEVYFIFDDNAPVHTPFHLYCFIMVGMVPEGSGVRHYKSVFERFSRLNRLLHFTSAIHDCW